MNEQNITDQQPLSWRAVDVEKLVGEDHPARAIWTLIGRLDLSPFYRARPFSGAARRKPVGDGVPQENGQRRSPAEIPSRGKNRGILSRVDQEQAGATTIPCARPGKGTDRNAMGLPHIQPAELDPPKQAPGNAGSHLRE
jgi:hypothetical protein